MAVKVFVSHKKEDAEQAASVAAHLSARGLGVYLDVIDAQLTKSGPDLADYIRAQLDQCTQLLAVISARTQASWWVPWEIGVATEKGRFLASFVSGTASVPEFLLKWPYLRTSADLDKYAAESKRAELLVEDRVQKRVSNHRPNDRVSDVPYVVEGLSWPTVTSTEPINTRRQPWRTRKLFLLLLPSKMRRSEIFSRANPSIRAPHLNLSICQSRTPTTVAGKKRCEPGSSGLRRISYGLSLTAREHNNGTKTSDVARHFLDTAVRKSSCHFPLSEGNQKA